MTAGRKVHKCGMIIEVESANPAEFGDSEIHLSYKNKREPDIPFIARCTPGHHR